MSPLLVVEALSLRFGGVVALADVGFTVEAGQRVALLGPNGAGKTSVLNCVSGVQRPASGRVTLRGTDLAGLPPSGRTALGLARTMQTPAVVDDLDVLGNLLLGRHHKDRAGMVGTALRLPRVRAEEAASARCCREIAAELGLTADLAKPADQLGPGARKRVELARALAMEPAVLLLDEPFAGASPDEVATMVAAVRRVSDAGAGVVLVDHDVATVLDLVHSTVVLEAGRVAAASAAISVP